MNEDAEFYYLRGIDDNPPNCTASIQKVGFEPSNKVYQLAAKYGYKLELWINDKMGAQFEFEFETDSYLTRFPSPWFGTVKELEENTIKLFNFFGEDFDERVSRVLFDEDSDDIPEEVTDINVLMEMY